MEYRISIDGMGCKNCAEKIEASLSPLPGVLSANVILEEKSALVICEDSCSPDTLTDAISQIKGDKKYTVLSVEGTGENCCCSGKHKERSEKEFRDLSNRLKRIEGQVRGVEAMLEKGVYCTDIITQVAAITAALNSFNKVLLANHIHSCVADNIRAGNDEIIDELVTILQKLMK